MKSANKYILPLAIVASTVSLPSIAIAYDEFSLLKQARQAEINGDYHKAIQKNNEYILTHPYFRDPKLWAKVTNRQYYLRNLLSAYFKLLKIYEKENNTALHKRKIDEIFKLYERDIFGSKNSYKIARAFLDYGEEERARIIFQKIIDDQVTSPRKNNGKVVLKSYKKLAEVYDKKGEKEALKELVRKLKENYPSDSCDLNDRYSVATLIHRHDGNSKEGEVLLKDILHRYENNPLEEHVSVTIRATDKIYEIYEKKRKYEEIGALSKRLIDRGVFRNLIDKEKYRLGAVLVKHGQVELGGPLLDEVIVSSPYSLETKKALFHLGREALKVGDWDKAIHYFSEYVRRFPDEKFFANKAYSKLLDAYFARDGYTEYLDQELTRFANIVSGISDYESILNFSRDLKWKGKDKLADSTFNIGLAAANRKLSEGLDESRKLKLRSVIAKYANALKKSDIVLANAQMVLELAGAVEKESINSVKRKKWAHRYKGQARLLIADTLGNGGDTTGARKQLRAFIAENPDDEDIHYAWYHLAKSHEEEGNEREALALYEKSRNGIWGRKAKKRLARMKRNAKDGK